MSTVASPPNENTPKTSRKDDEVARVPIIVVAGILVEAGRVLVTQRPAGSHLAFAWEFPGGKVEPGEDPRAALARELFEELGIRVEVGNIVDVVFHRYPEKDVLLLFFAVKRTMGSPAPLPLEVAALEWREAARLNDNDFPKADVPVLEAVRGLLKPR